MNPTFNKKIVVEWSCDANQFIVASYEPNELSTYEFLQAKANKGNPLSKCFTISGIKSWKCLKWSPHAALRSKIIVGLMNGEVLLMNLSDSNITTVKEFVRKEKIACNALSWHPTNPNQIAAGFDKLRSNSSGIILWDLEKQGSDKLQSLSGNPIERISSPLGEALLSEGAAALSWVPNSDSCLLAGTTQRWVRLIDFRNPSQAPKSANAHERGGIYGCLFDPFNEHRFATYSLDSVIKIWDVRKFTQGPTLAFTTHKSASKGKPFRQIAWCPTRSGKLAAISYEEDDVKIWDLELVNSLQPSSASSSSSSSTPVILKPQRIHQSRDILCVSWHPRNECKLLTVSQSGVFDVVSLNESIPLSFSATSQLCFAYGKTVVYGQEPAETSEKADISDVMKYRGKIGYGININKNIEISQMKFHRKRTAHSLYNYWSWFRAITSESVNDDPPAPSPASSTAASRKKQASAAIKNRTRKKEKYAGILSILKNNRKKKQLVHRTSSTNLSNTNSNSNNNLDSNESNSNNSKQNDMLNSNENNNQKNNDNNDINNTNTKQNNENNNSMNLLNADNSKDNTNNNDQNNNKEKDVSGNTSDGSENYENYLNSEVVVSADRLGTKFMASNDEVNIMLKQFPVYSSPQRDYVLRICGWKNNDSTLEEIINQLEHNNEYDRAVALAVFNLDLRRAIFTLSKYPDSHIISMALSGYSYPRNNGNSNMENNLWRETCKKLKETFPSQYLKAIFTFLCSEKKEDYKDVLEAKGINILDKIGFACKFLKDDDLIKFVESVTHECIRKGLIEGIALTGLTKEGVELLQNYVNGTGDIQTAGLGMAFAVPSKFQDTRASQWLQIYKSLLDQWELYHERARLDVAIAQHLRLSSSSSTGSATTSTGGSTDFNEENAKGRQPQPNRFPDKMMARPFGRTGPWPGASSSSSSISQTGGGGGGGGGGGSGGGGLSASSFAARQIQPTHSSATNNIFPQVFASCLHCRSSLVLRTLSEERKDSNMISRSSFAVPSTVVASGQGKQRLAACPTCKKPLPNCAICLLPLGASAPVVSKNRVKIGENEGCWKEGSQKFDDWFTWCLHCRHGGHARHIVDWFATHKECPVSACDCKCASF